MNATFLNLLAFLGILVSALLIGGGVLQVAAPRAFGPTQRILIAAALGLPLLAYVTLALGLTLGLHTAYLGALVVSAALLGLALGRGEPLPHLLPLLHRVGGALLRSPHRVWYWLLVVWTGVLLVRALAPPALADWDGLAEHLAMAKEWLRARRIVPLWYDHHSQFPATVQMLYVLGLALGGPVAAKLFHTLYGLLALAAVGVLVRRHFGRSLTAWALVIFAATPMVGWLCSVAYVDLAAVFYLLLGLDFFLEWLARRTLGPAAWAGVCLGLAAAVKMQSLAYAGGLVAVAGYLAWRCRKIAPARLGQWAALLALAALVASPWYLKSWIITGNPVYPFAYSLFGGKQWSQEQARTYAYQQKSWGWGDLPPPEQFWALPPLQRAFAGPRRPGRMLLAPLGLTFLPWKYVDAGFGKTASFFMASVGPLYLALLPLLLLGPRPRAWPVIAWALLPVAVWWLATAQYSRYALPGLAWLAPAAAYAAEQAAQRGPAARAAIRVSLALTLVLAVISLSFGIGANLSVILGVTAPEAYLAAALPGLYPALKFINERMPPGAKIISYGEPRLFYLDRPYLWGEPNYHQLLDYGRMRNAEDLVSVYRNLGITHVLVNRQFFPAGVEANRRIAALLEEGLAHGYLRRLTPREGFGPYEVLELITRGETRHPDEAPARQGVK